ncbi:MAG: hypothetical protein C4318_02660 [Acidimicrobiia bacterium]
MQGRVLVVSADPARRRTFRDNLFLAGHTAFDAPNRSAAIEACEDFKPSVAVIDLAGSALRAQQRAARGKSGKTSVDCNLLRQIASRFPSVRLLAICDGENGPTPESAVQAGAHDYLREPVCIGELLVRVDKHLGISTKVKRLRRVSPRPRKKIILRYMASDSALELAKTLASQLSENDKSQTTPTDPPYEVPVQVSEANSDLTASGSPEPLVRETGTDNWTLLARDGSISDTKRLSDLVSADHANDGATMAWISMQGLDKAISLGLVAYESVSKALDPAIDHYFPNASKWWAGSEAIVALSTHIASPVEIAIELKSAIADILGTLGISDQIALRVSATTRRWGEGRAIFLARATGRISNGSLPVSPFEAGSRPHPEVTLPTEAAKIRSTSSSSTAPTSRYSSRVEEENGVGLKF